MERGRTTKYPTQVCLFVMISGLRHYMRLSVEHPVGLYAAFFKNGSVAHGARLAEAKEDVPTIPIFEWSWFQPGGVVGLHRQGRTGTRRTES